MPMLTLTPGVVQLPESCSDKLIIDAQLIANAY